MLFNLGATLARVAAAFLLAMSFGAVIGVLMGRHKAFDRIADSWVIILLNLPALVIIVLAYVWVGLNEACGPRAAVRAPVVQLRRSR